MVFVDSNIPMYLVGAAAKAIILERRPLSARDALHVAVMERRGITRILTFDRGFDAIPGLTRLT